MKPLLLKEIVSAVEGILKFGDMDESVLNVSTDSRKISKGDLFVPIRGEFFDGHSFIDNAFDKGAACVLSEEELSCKMPWIKVESTKKALMDLAEYYRSLFDVTVVAVTGSTGKTTTKEIIYSVLKQKYNVLKTEGNFNNEIGVPLTIFNLNDSIQAAVIELGMNHFGEIHNLSKIVKPDIAVITNIGVSHIENLGSRNGILKAKCEIFDFIAENGLKVLNSDDDMILSLKDKEKNTCFYGTEKYDSDFYADNIEERGLSGIGCVIHNADESFCVDIPLPGKHMVLNSLAAAATGRRLGLDFYEIKKGIESFEPAKMRMNIIETDKYTVINDVYNANPNSVKASIDVVSSVGGRKVCILGDMLELGEYAEKLHEEIGEYAVLKKINIVVCIGELAENIYKGAVKILNGKNSVFYFKNQEEFFESIDDILKEKDTILVKASRGMKFEKTIEKITR